MLCLLISVISLLRARTSLPIFWSLLIKPCAQYIGCLLLLNGHEEWPLLCISFTKWRRYETLGWVHVELGNLRTENKVRKKPSVAQCGTLLNSKEMIVERKTNSVLRTLS